MARLEDGKRDAALTALQRGLPLCARPFEALGREAGCTAGELLAALKEFREEGLVRRFGAVFDTRRLGYRSVLCAAATPRGEQDAVAARLAPMSGVTHCYVREPDGGGSAGMPELWFTLSCPEETFGEKCEEVRELLAPHAVNFLPATKRFKIDVVFGAAVRAREERTDADDGPMTDGDRAMVAALQGDTEEREDYFAAIAERLGVKEWDLLSRLEMWRRAGRLKRIGLLLAHRNAGWTANGMCCWRVAGDVTAAGRALAECGEVTHCYERPMMAGFEYNLFAMVHARSRESARGQFGKLDGVLRGIGGGVEVEDGVMLISTKEYKKTSMTFFA